MQHYGNEICSSSITFQNGVIFGGDSFGKSDSHDEIDLSGKLELYHFDKLKFG